MREIHEYRGKRKIDGKWVYGSLVKNEVWSVIVEDFEPYACEYGWGMNGHEVEPETVGRIISLQDKNGREIYEGDIVRHMFIRKKELYAITWNDDSASFYMKPLERGKTGGFSLFRNSKGFLPYEVIGNIYENQKLLEGKK